MDHQAAVQYMKNAQGQLNSALKMAEDNRYCVDISYQVLASIALLKKANDLLLKTHLENCVRDSFVSGDAEEKIDEVLKLLNKMMD